MTDSNQINRQSSDEIELRELFSIIWKGKWIIILITLVFAVGSVLYALSLPNIYAAEAKLAPTEQSQGGGGLGGGMGGQLGGLASLAGLQMGQQQVTPAVLAREILQSRAFITDFVERRDIKADLMAVSEWNHHSDELKYNKEVYDAENLAWFAGAEPTAWQFVNTFRNQLSVEEDTVTGLMTIKVEHLSPVVAKQWVDWLIEDINNEMRQRDIEEAKRGLEYIEREMANAQLRSTQQIYSGLMEQQTQTIMLANVRPEYVYTVVDPAVVPEQRERPSRALIVVIGTLLGGFLSLLLILITYLFRHVK